MAKTKPKVADGSHHLPMWFWLTIVVVLSVLVYMVLYYYNLSLNTPAGY